MKQIKRSEFLGTAIPDEEKNKKAPLNQFANKAMPHFDEKSMTGLSQYAGTFGTAQLAHLLRRTLFGVTQADLNYFNSMTLDQVVAALLTQSPTPSPPVNAYNNSNYTDPLVPLGQTWVNAVYGDGTGNALRRRSLKNWWVGLMLNQDRSISEKMTLFWHNHFATQMASIGDACFCYMHHSLLRANALGNFKTLARAVTTDPGMLIYLNGDTNTAAAPNENYGREFQELFTVGKGPNSLYTQADVEAAAHVLTGWKDVRSTLSSIFNPAKHDTSNKTFSAFYNNTVITGQSGANGALETDQFVDMVFAQTETAKNFCRDLYRFFIYYTIDAQVEANVITPLANIMVQNNYDIVPVLSTLFKSEHFFDINNVGCHIKNPVDHLIGVCRQFNIAFPDASNITNQYKGWSIIANALLTMQMDPGDPPNVAGWPAYYQEPQYHEIWINSVTLPLRNQYTDLFSSLGGLTVSGINLKMDLIAFTQQFSNPGDPNQLIADAAALLSPNDLGSTQTTFLKSILLSGQLADHYWTDAWNQYVGSPGNQTYLTTVLNRLRSMYAYIMELAEYQLI